MRLTNNLQEDKIKHRKAAKLSAKNSPKLEDMIEVVLSDNKTRLYFPKDKPLDKMTERIMIHENKINCISKQIEEATLFANRTPNTNKVYDRQNSDN